MIITPPPSVLRRELHLLTEQGILSADQAARLWQAAEQDRSQSSPSPAPRRPPAAAAVLDALGYIGGTLLLAAAVFVGSTLWDDWGRGQRVGLAVASFVVPLTGALLLHRQGTRRGLASVLLALSCVAAGFLTSTVFDHRQVLLSYGVVVVTALVGAVWLRSPVFYGPGWIAAMLFTERLISDELPITAPGQTAYAVAVGFVVVGVVMVGCGLLLDRRVAWTLAGLSGWTAAGVLMAYDRYAIAVVVATAVAAALFGVMIRRRIYACAVVGCLILLSIWPWALYQILDSALGVAIGLVAAGCILIGAAVVLARGRLRGVPTGPPAARTPAQEP